MAKRKGISGWNTMRKDDLVKALVKSETSKAGAKPAAKAAAKPAGKAAASKGEAKPAKSAPKRSVKAAAAAKSTKGAGKAVVKESKKSAEAKKPAAKATSKPVTKSPAAKSPAAKSGAAKNAATKSAAAQSAVKTAAKKSAGAVPAPKGNVAKVAAKPAAEPKAEAKSVSKSDSVVSKSAASVKPVAAAKPVAASAATAEKPAGGVAKSSIAKSSTAKIAAETKAERAKQHPPTKTSPKVIRKIQEVQERADRRRDLAGDGNGNGAKQAKDRCALLVRDPYWLQAYWEISRETVERAKVALAAHWHTVQPMLRLAEIDDAGTTSTAERIVREIPVHGGVCNWYIDVVDPPKTYRVTLGYKAATGKFHTLSRSNKVTTPSPGASDLIDGNWSDIAENCEKIFALSGGYAQENSDQQLRELFEERLRRPMGSPSVTQYGSGADLSLGRMREFEFAVDAEMIVFGHTDPTAYVTLGGEPIKLRGDGTFAVRLPLPDRRQVLPIVASSADGVEQRTTVLAVERNTKVMEPLIRENGED